MKTKFILLVCALIFSTNIYSQSPPDCIDTSCPWDTLGDGFTDWFLINPGCELRVQYEIRFCPEPEFRIINWELRGSNCGNLSPSTLRDMSTLFLLTQYGGTILPCGTEVVTTNVYTANCIFEQVCEYTSSSTFSATCNTPLVDPPYPPGSTSFTTTKHLPCGQICCKQTYGLCEVSEPGSLGTYIKVRKLGPPSTFGDCDGATALGVNPNDCIPLCGN